MHLILVEDVPYTLSHCVRKEQRRMEKVIKVPSRSPGC
jgi:hypothetical protein